MMTTRRISSHQDMESCHIKGDDTQSRDDNEPELALRFGSDNILALDHARRRVNRLRRASKTKLPSPMRFASTVSLLTWLCLSRPVAGADNPLVVEIWPGRVPDEIGNIGAERFRM